MFSGFLVFSTEILTALNTGGKLREVGLFFYGQRGKMGLVWKKWSMRCGSVCASFKLLIGVMSAYYTCTLQIHCLLHMYHYLLFTSLIFTGFNLKITSNVNKREIERRRGRGKYMKNDCIIVWLLFTSFSLFRSLFLSIVLHNENT